MPRTEGKERGGEKKLQEHRGAKCYRASTSIRSIRRLVTFPLASSSASRELSFSSPSPSPFRIPFRGARGWKLSYDVTATLPKVARYGNEARLDANRESSFASFFLSFPLFLPSVAVETIPRIKLLHRRGSLGDKALFQDFRALYTGPTSRIVC